MNKRNFLLDFALKSKYNFFACVVALLVLIFAVSSITYSWIEGATSLQIQSGATARVYANADRAVNVAAQPTASNKTLSLENYIDPADCYFAPARGTLNSDNTISVQFLNDGATDTAVDTSYREATANDISNNYIFFETKIKPDDDISSYKFLAGSRVSVPSIKVGLTVLSADRTPLYSNIFTPTDVSNGVLACSGLTGNTEYIIQFRIWNDVTHSDYSANLGKEVAINFTLVPQSDFTTLYLRDYTNSETSQKLLSGKTVKVIIGSKETTGVITTGTEYNSYTFEKVPNDADSLQSVKFVAYNSDNSVFATWDLTGTAVAEQSIYNVYGSASAATTYGTFGELKKVSLIDKSYENILKADTTVALNNGTESYVMYRGTSTTNFSAYVPATATNFKFSNTAYYAEETEAVDSTTPTYYILGESKTTSDGKTKCVGFWNASSTLSSFTEITIYDRTTGRLVEGSSVYASYPDTLYPTVQDTLYKAYYDSSSRVWKLTATSSSFTNDDTGMVWNFKAYNSAGTTEKYSWYVDGRKAITTTAYTFKTAVAGTNASDGTWGIYEVSQINPYILYEDSNKLVSFYGGVQSNWAAAQEGGYTVNYINAVSSTDTANNQAARTANGTYTISNIEYRVAKFVDKPSLNYYLKNITTFGVQIGEPAEGGKFYGLNSVGSDNVVRIDAITGSTTLNGSNSTSSTNKISLLKGPVSFETESSSATSFLGENLYIEYHICPTGEENSANYYCINPSIVDNEGTLGANSTQVDASKITTSTFDFTDQALAAFLSTNGDNYTLKTVLTDGSVYYVSDVDYITFTGEAQTVSVTLNAVDNAVATVTYSGGTVDEGNTVDSIYQGTALTLSATPDDGYEFTKFEIYDTSNVLRDTIETNNSTYVVPDYDIIIKTIVTEQTQQWIYLENAAGWPGTPQAHIWVGSTPIYDYNASQSNMTLVSGNVWKYEVPSDFTNGKVIFHYNGDQYKSAEENIQIGKIYNNSTGQWSDYSGGTTTDPTVAITQVSNATITARYGSNSFTGSVKVPSGTQLTVEVAPASGYTVKSIIINGTTYTNFTTTDGVAGYTISSVTSDTTITATVEKTSSSTSTTTIYLKNDANWSTPMAHIWGSGDYKTWNSADEKMTYDSALDMWYYTMPEDVAANYNRICFHNGGSNTTSDLVLYYGYVYNNSGLLTWAPIDSTVADTKVITLTISGAVATADTSGKPVYYLYSKDSSTYYFADSKTYSSGNTYKFTVPKDCTSFTIERKNPDALTGNAWNTWTQTVSGTTDQTITISAW